MKMKFAWAAFGGLFLVVAYSATAQDDGNNETLGGLAVDAESTAAILEATTLEDYLTPWVSSLPDHPTIPSPRD